MEAPVVIEVAAGPEGAQAQDGLGLPERSSVLSNAVLVWNTVRIAAIVKELEASSGQPVPRKDLARISPLLSARLLVSGRHFESAAHPPEE